MVTRHTLWVILILLMLPVLCMAEELEKTLAGFMNRDLTLNVKVILDEYTPLDTQRTRELSNLISHLEGIWRHHDMSHLVSGTDLSDPDMEDEQQDLFEIQVDGKRVAWIHRYRERDETCWKVNSADKVFQGGDDAFLSLLGTEVSEMEDYLIRTFEQLAWVADIRGALSELMVSDLISREEKKESQRVTGYGETQKRVTFSIPESMDVLQLVKELESQRLSFSSVPLTDAVQGLMFAGRQNLYALTEDTGIVHKYGYSGTIDFDDHVWHVTASWKTDGAGKDALSLEAQKAKVSGEKNCSFKWSLTSEAKDEHTWTGTLQTITKEGSVQRVGSVSAHYQILDWNLQGLLEIRLSGSTKGNDGILLILEPELHVSENGLSLIGQVSFRYTTDQVNPYSGILQIAMQASTAKNVDLGSSADPADQTVQLSSLSEEEKESIRNELFLETSRALLRELVLVNEEDTVFLRRDLDETDWADILRLACPEVEDE